MQEHRWDREKYYIPKLSKKEREEFYKDDSGSVEILNVKWRIPLSWRIAMALNWMAAKKATYDRDFHEAWRLHKKAHECGDWVYTPGLVKSCLKALGLSKNKSLYCCK